jgi:hypothetical protein
MATRYDGLTQQQLDAIYNEPYNVMSPFALVQNCMFPIRAIQEGMKTDKTPEQIGDMAYEEICNLTAGRFTDVQLPTIKNVALFMKAAVQKKIEDALAVVKIVLTTASVTATPVELGETLASSTLTGSFTDNEVEVPGVLAWVDDTEVVAESGVGTYEWVFTPTDTTKYEVKTGSVMVSIAV